VKHGLAQAVLPRIFSSKEGLDEQHALPEYRKYHRNFAQRACASLLILLQQRQIYDYS
jgi:hypothetical protein